MSLFRRSRKRRKGMSTFAAGAIAIVAVVIFSYLAYTKFANRIVANFHHCSARYAVFSYPLEDVSGTLDIEPDHWEFTGECGAPDCREAVSLTLAEYEAQRAAGQPVVAPGHGRHA